MVGEIRAGLDDFDSRGVWAMSGACPSGIWGVADFLGDDYGPNCLNPKADDVLNCTQLQNEFGGSSDGLIALWMPCSDDNGPNNWPNWQQTIRSMHTGGAYIALADGSVQWISDLVQTSTSATVEEPTVWDCLISSGDGKISQPDQYSFPN